MPLFWEVPLIATLGLWAGSRYVIVAQPQVVKTWGRPVSVRLQPGDVIVRRRRIYR